MEDQEIIDLYFARDERAIEETGKKYGTLSLQLARNILSSSEEAEECVNDAYYSLWDTIPPTRPVYFRAYLCRIVRNLSLKRLEYLSAKKRTATQMLSFEELENLLPAPSGDSFLSEQELGRLISDFLRQEKPLSRMVFLQKYWFFDPIQDIARRHGCTEAKIKSMLLRSRRKLKAYLQKEGITV